MQDGINNDTDSAKECKEEEWDKTNTFFFNSSVNQGPFIRKPDNANLGLKFNQGPCFSCFKSVYTANSK